MDDYVMWIINLDREENPLTNINLRADFYIIEEIVIFKEGLY